MIGGYAEVGLLGLAKFASRFLTAAPFLKLVAGGSGNGRFDAEVAAEVGNRFIGESILADVRAAIGIPDF